MVSFITIPAVTLHGMTAFPCHNLGGKRRLVSGYAFGFQHFHHLVGGGGGSALFEVAGNHKDGVPPAYLGHAIRAVVAVLFLGVSVIGKSPFRSAAF